MLKIEPRNFAIVCRLIVLATLALALIPSVDCYIKRTQYHEQGLHGPKSYKFGYTAGDYKNPQERHEESDGYGHVKGWYSFKDAYGKKQVVYYEAHPKYGFKVHHNQHHHKHHHSSQPKKYYASAAAASTPKATANTIAATSALSKKYRSS